MKMNIALKEASEIKYWLRLLKATGFISNNEFDPIFFDCVELEKILTSNVVCKNIFLRRRRNSFPPQRETMSFERFLRGTKCFFPQ